MCVLCDTTEANGANIVVECKPGRNTTVLKLKILFE